MRDWRDDASCKDDPEPDAWFPGPGDQEAMARAVRVCLGCPVRSECLADALEHERIGHAHGIAGGLSARQRRDLART